MLIYIVFIFLYLLQSRQEELEKEKETLEVTVNDLESLYYIILFFFTSEKQSNAFYQHKGDTFF